jgi:ribosomal protein L14
MPQAERSPGLVVIQPIRDWVCAECGGTGELLRMDDAGPLCLACADLGHLVFLPAGDAALTRRATKASSLSAVVVRWSRTRKRYERQGVLVEDPALVLAEEQCLSDEDARMRRRERDRGRRADADEEFQSRLAEEIARLFPGCPSGRATAIARHTGLRGSGRAGRSAAGRALDEDAVTLAVTASVRHQDTGYDALLMSGLPRDAARGRVRAAIDRVLANWREPSRNPGQRA